MTSGSPGADAETVTSQQPTQPPQPMYWQQVPPPAPRDLDNTLFWLLALANVMLLGILGCVIYIWQFVREIVDAGSTLSDLFG